MTELVAENPKEIESIVMDYRLLSPGTAIVELSLGINNQIWEALAASEIFLGVSAGGRRLTTSVLSHRRTPCTLHVPMDESGRGLITVDANLAREGQPPRLVSTSITLPPSDFLQGHAAQVFENEDGVTLEPGDLMQVVGGFYVVNGSITICQGATLYLDPGVTMTFHEGHGLYCEGKLFIRGGAGPNEAVELNGEKWAGVLLNGTHVDGSTLTHCKLVGGRGYPASLYKQDGTFSGRLETYWEGAGVPQYGGNLLIANTREANITMDSVVLSDGEADFGGGLGLFRSTVTIGENGLVVEENIARQSGGGIWMMKSKMKGHGTVSVTKNRAARVGGGMSLSYDSDCTVRRVTFDENAAESEGPNAYVFCRNVPSLLAEMPGVSAFPYKTP